jgi:hypothetical protein
MPVMEPLGVTTAQIEPKFMLQAIEEWADLHFEECGERSPIFDQRVLHDVDVDSTDQDPVPIFSFRGNKRSL